MYFKPNTSIDQKVEIYKAYGLNDKEIQATLTPLAQHTPDMRKLAFEADAKIKKAVELENEEYDKKHPKLNMTVMQRLQYDEEERQTKEMEKSLSEGIEQPAIQTKESP